MPGSDRPFFDLPTFVLDRHLRVLARDAVDVVQRRFARLALLDGTEARTPADSAADNTVSPRSLRRRLPTRDTKPRRSSSTPVSVTDANGTQVWPPTGAALKPILSSVDNAWLAVGLRIVRERVPALAAAPAPR